MRTIPTPNADTFYAGFPSFPLQNKAQTVTVDAACTDLLTFLPLSIACSNKPAWWSYIIAPHIRQEPTVDALIYCHLPSLLPPILAARCLTKLPVHGPRHWPGMLLCFTLNARGSLGQPWAASGSGELTHFQGVGSVSSLHIYSRDYNYMYCENS